MPAVHTLEDFDAWVADLAVAHRSRAAYWHLVSSGPPALPAVRRGLSSPSADVRRHCVRVLDHLVDDESFPALVGTLDDEDAGVRANALHALACDRCKENGCRPTKADVFPHAVRLLLGDPDRHVRAMAAEVVARWVHTDEEAEAALVAAHERDPSPAVRKKAGWYVPGGPIHRRTMPRPGSRLAAEAAGTVTVLVSHRFSTVRMADHIVVLDEGRVREQGTHAELVARGDLYAELYDLQARSYR